MSTIAHDSDIAALPLGELLSSSILPQVEFLSGILSQTSWMQVRGPKGKGNLYFQELQQFFDKYKNHKAIVLMEEMVQKGFKYHVPLLFILDFEGFPDMKLRSEYDSFLLDMELITIDDLEALRMAFCELAKESNFIDFYKSHFVIYNNLLQNVFGEFEGQKITNWFQKYFGSSNNIKFHTILAPAMFRSGGYGINKNIDGINVCFEIKRESGKFETDEMRFGYTLSSRYAITIHEMLHSFINPVNISNLSKIEDLGLYDIMRPVQEKMENIAYGHVYSFYNELFVRSCTLIAYEELFGKDEYYDSILGEDTEKGFYCIVPVLDYIKMNYFLRPNQISWNVFIFELFDFLVENKNNFLRLINK